MAPPFAGGGKSVPQDGVERIDGIDLARGVAALAPACRACAFVAADSYAFRGGPAKPPATPGHNVRRAFFDGIYGTGFKLRPPLESGLMSRAQGELTPSVSAGHSRLGLPTRTPIGRGSTEPAPFARFRDSPKGGKERRRSSIRSTSFKGTQRRVRWQKEAHSHADEKRAYEDLVLGPAVLALFPAHDPLRRNT
jgi:hypothetical protein